MARVLVLTDRHPLDTDWKGAVAWNLILSLSESQHQVLVLTTQDPETIHITHPRLTIARPAKTWDARHLPKFLKGILLFRPEIIHTFALKPSRLWKGLTIWPYLHPACRVLPGLRRFSTLFEIADLPEGDPSWAWHIGSHRTVVFSDEQKLELEAHMNRAAEVSPLEIEPLQESEDEDLNHSYILIPAPVGEWKNPQRDLLMLAKHLIEHPDLHAHVSGGWGDWPASSRRMAWSKMMPIASRLHMLEAHSMPELMREVRRAKSLWCEPLVKDSWRSLLAAQVAAALNVPTEGGRPALTHGSTANFLSRLFAGSVDSWR
jgi:hypothetical protein